jgi:hypothetical protein
MQVKGDSSGINTTVDNIKLEDAFYRQLTNQVQYRAYDGSTRYLGFLGYAMPEDHTSTNFNYINLDQTLIDSTYYPNPEAMKIKVIGNN